MGYPDTSAFARAGDSMPRKTTSSRPKKLDGYEQHGFRSKGNSGGWYRGPCPLCGSDTRDPFGVSSDGDGWKCQSCGESGGFNDFLSAMSALQSGALRGALLAKLAKSRSLPEDAIKRWGCGWCSSGAFYSIPVRDHAGNVVGLHRYYPDRAKDARLISTSGGKNGVFTACADALEDAKTVWVCEGEWDAIALDSALRAVDSDDVVVGVSGAGAAREVLALACQSKEVYLAFDADDAGIKGDVAAREALQGRASSVESVHWPEDLPKGYDVRDMYVKSGDKPRRMLRKLRSFLKDAPRRLHEADDAQPTNILPGDFPSRGRIIAGKLSGRVVPRDEVIARYRKWLHLPDTIVLDVMFGTVLGNRLDGDPLWMFIVGPPGCGKSACLMSLSDAPLVVTRTTVTRAALVCGMPNIGTSDPSLLPKLDGQVLVVKDFTTILSTQDKVRDELFGVLRDAYDGKYEQEFGRGVLRKYVCRFGILAGVTAKIEELGPTHAIAGERFVKFYMRHSSARVGAGKQAIKRAAKNRKHHTQMQRELCEVAREVLARPIPEEPEIGEHEQDVLCGMAMWTANMRGAVTRDKWSKEMIFKPSAEVGTRLVAEFGKLAAGVAIFRGKSRVGEDELAVVARVARDSAPDITEEIVRQLYVRSRDDYIASGVVARHARLPWDVTSKRLDDMELLGVVQKDKAGSFRLSRAMVRLMQPLNLYTGEKTWGRK